MPYYPIHLNLTLAREEKKVLFFLRFYVNCVGIDPVDENAIISFEERIVVGIHLAFELKPDMLDSDPLMLCFSKINVADYYG